MSYALEQALSDLRQPRGAAICEELDLMDAAMIGFALDLALRNVGSLTEQLEASGVDASHEHDQLARLRHAKDAIARRPLYRGPITGGLPR